MGDKVIGISGFKYTMPVKLEDIVEGKRYWVVNLHDIPDKPVITFTETITPRMRMHGSIFEKRIDACRWLDHIVFVMGDLVKKLRENPSYFPPQPHIRFYQYRGKELAIPATAKYIAYQRNRFIQVSDIEIYPEGEEWKSDSAVMVGILDGADWDSWEAYKQGVVAWDKSQQLIEPEQAQQGADE